VILVYPMIGADLRPSKNSDPLFDLLLITAKQLQVNTSAPITDK